MDKKYFKIIAGVCLAAFLFVGMSMAIVVVGNYFKRGQLGARDVLILNDRMEVKAGGTILIEDGGLLDIDGVVDFEGATVEGVVVFGSTLEAPYLILADGASIDGTLDADTITATKAVLSGASVNGTIDASGALSSSTISAPYAILSDGASIDGTIDSDTITNTGHIGTATITASGAADVLTLQADSITVDNTATVGTGAPTVPTTITGLTITVGVPTAGAQTTLTGLTVETTTVVTLGLDVNGDADISGTLDTDTLDVDGDANFAQDVDIVGTLDVDTLEIDSTEVTSTAVELNKLDGTDATVLDFNTLHDAIDELKQLDGAGATTADFVMLHAITAGSTDINNIDGLTVPLGALVATAAQLNVHVHNDGTAGLIDFNFEGVCIDGETLTMTIGTTTWSFEISDSLPGTCPGTPDICMGMTVLSDETCSTVFAAAINGSTIPDDVAANMEASDSGFIVAVVSVAVNSGFTLNEDFTNMETSAGVVHGATGAKILDVALCQVEVTSAHVTQTTGAGGWMSVCAMPTTEIPIMYQCNIVDSSGDVIAQSNVSYNFEQASSSNYYMKLTDGGGGSDLTATDVITCFAYSAY